MVGENKRDRRDFHSGVEKESPTIDTAGDHLEVEKMNALGGAGDEVERMGNQEGEVVDKVSDKDRATQKKPRFIWTQEVHTCFLDAIERLGFHNAVPTKILALMNVEDLTRENVASHLQKYRQQVKRKEKERSSENFPKDVHPHMSGIHQQPRVIPNTMQGINTGCVSLDGSQLAPSLANHSSNMIQTFPTIHKEHGPPFRDSFDEGVNRMGSVRLMHGFYDSNGPHDINKIGHNYGQFPPKPLVDSYSNNLMDRHDTTLVPQYYRPDEWSLQDIISPLVPQYDRRDELSLRGIISPSFVPQYDRHNELFVADQGIISPLLAQNIEGLGVGVPHQPQAVGDPIGMKVEGIEVGMPRPPTRVLSMKIETLGLGVPPRLPEATGGPGLSVPWPPEASGGHDGMNDFRLGFPFVDDVESSIDSYDFPMNMKGDVDDKSLDGFTFR